MPTTAKTYFDEDITRAKALLTHALALDGNGVTQMSRDIRGAAVAMAVGAMDAYFCDKYVDCLTKALSAYSTGVWPGQFPSSYRKQQLPAGEVLDASRPHRPRWGIRMAARAVMEKDYMYSLTRLDDAFNGSLPTGQKLWDGIAGDLAALGRKRFTTYLAADLAHLQGKALQDARKKVIATVKQRIGMTVQFRHDWIHNCSRPKAAIVNYTHGKATAAIGEIKSLIEVFETHVEKHRIV